MWFWLSETVQQPDTRSLTIIFLIFPAREPVWNPWLEQAVSFSAWCWNIIHVRVTFLSLLEKFIENWFAGTKPAIAICLVQGPRILSFSCMKRLSSNFIQEWREIGQRVTCLQNQAAKPCLSMHLDSQTTWALDREDQEHNTALLIGSYHIMKSLELITWTAWVNALIPVMA